MAEQAQHAVFLSHNNADKPAVEELARRLVREGIQPWLDTWNLIPGEPWQEAIEEALAHCATCAVFIGPSGTGPWQNEEMRAGIDRRVSESKGSFRVIPVLLPGAERGERSRLPTFLVATTWVEFRRSLDDEAAFHQLLCGIRGIEPGPGPGQAVYEGECPYRGLQVFDVKHAPFFFGREALTEWLLDDLRGDNRFLAIIGPSGSGKSSLARAGLVTALRRGEIEGSETWPIVICRPGADPLESLAVALGDATGIAQTPSAVRDLIRDLCDDERMLHLTARLALRDAPPERRLALLVDQFEELFTLCHDEELRQALVNNLLYAASVVGGQTEVLLTLRTDFYGKCAPYPALAAALSDHQVLVGPMTNAEMRRAIERPARLAGCEFEHGLVDLLMHDVENQPGSLPLLQHTLLELWGRREGRRLTHAAYKAIGGVKGALEGRAEEIYDGFTAAEKEICRRVFLRLTQPGEGTEDTKRRATLRELMPAEGEREMVESVIWVLAGEEARLVTIKAGKEPKGEQFVEAAHEALIQGWSRLREWIERDREALRTHRRLGDAAEEWKKSNRHESYLYRGAWLATAEEWAEDHGKEMNVLEREFLEASLALRAREEAKELETARRLAEEAEARAREQQEAAAGLRQRAVIAVVFGIAAIILAMVTLTQRDNAIAARRKADRLAITAMTKAAALDVSRDPAHGVVLALGAISLTNQTQGVDIAEPIHVLRQNLAAWPSQHVLMTGLESIYSVAFSPDGETLVAGGSNGLAKWDVTNLETPPEIPAGFDSVESVAFSADRVLATSSSDGIVHVWDLTSEPYSLPEPSATDLVHAYSVAWSPNGALLASGNNNGLVQVWERPTPGSDWDVPHQLRIAGEGLFPVESLTFSPDGHTLAAAGYYSITLWATADLMAGVVTPSQVLSCEDLWGIEWLAFLSKEEKERVLLAGHDRKVYGWDLAESSAECESVGDDLPEGLLPEGAFVRVSPSGRWFASGGSDNTVRLADLETWQAPVLRGHDRRVTSLAFDPDEHHLASGSDDGTVRLWNLMPAQMEPQTYWHGFEAKSLAFDQDGHILASGVVTAGNVGVWDPTDLHTTTILAGQGDDWPTSVTLSPDRRWVASTVGYYSSTLRVWNLTEPGKSPREFEAFTSWALNAEGQTLALGDDEGVISLRNLVEEPTQVLTLSCPQDWSDLDKRVVNLAFSPDGGTLAGQYGNGSIYVWDLTSKDMASRVIKEPWSIRLHPMVFSSDGRTLAGSSGYDTVYLWDLTNPSAGPKQLTGRDLSIVSLAFSPDGNNLAAGNRDGIIRMWNLTGPQQSPQMLEGHRGQVISLAFSPDGRLLASGDEGETVRVWRTTLEGLEDFANQSVHYPLDISEFLGE